MPARSTPARSSSPNSSTRPIPDRLASLRTRHDISRFGLRRPAPNAAMPADSAPSRFVSGLAFLAVTYSDQILSVPQPTLSIELNWKFVHHTAAIPPAGLTIELWFNAQSNGILVAENAIQRKHMASHGPTALVPLLYIDGGGRLRGGLFDGTTLTPWPIPQRPLTSVSNDVPFIGAANSIASPCSVVDGDWHHAALVVAPIAGSTDGQQSLYLDGRLVGTTTGSFSLNDPDQYDFHSLGALQLGGSIVPVALEAPIQPINYPQGFIGAMDEIRVWACARLPSEIQQLMDQPLTGTDIAQCLVYVGVDANYACPSMSLGQQQAFVPATGTYLQIVPSQVPFDPFPTVTDRLTGYENYGLFLATHFAAPEMPVTFQRALPCRMKVGLRLCDVLMIAFPTESASGDDLNGKFSLTCIEGNTQTTKTIGPLKLGSSQWLTAGGTGTYLLEFVYSGTPAAMGLQFQVIPAAASTLMQTLLNFDNAPTTPTLLMAYSDPNYPALPQTTTDPRHNNPAVTVTLPAYWPLFSDTTFFPAPPSYDGDWSDDLLAAYLNLRDATPPVLAHGSFGDYRNLLTNAANDADPVDYTSALPTAYAAAGYGQPPSPPPESITFGPGPYATPQEAVYAHIYNANLMRTNVDDFLHDYAAFVQANTNTLSAIDIPSNIATEIYADQGFGDQLALSSSGGFFANLFGQAAMWGIGAALAVFAPPLGAAFELSEEVIAELGTALSAVGSAAASMGSETLSTFVTSSASGIVPPGQASCNTLTEIANNVTTVSNEVWQNMQTLLNSGTFRQHIYSNYGLLQALQTINAANLQAPTIEVPNNPLIVGYTYATWRALVPAVFSWRLEFAQFPDPRGITTIYVPNMPATMPQSAFVPLNALMNQQPGMLTEMLQTAYALQQGQRPYGERVAHFITMSAYAAENFQHKPVLAGIINEWHLVDRNNNPIDPGLARALFGVDVGTLTLVPVDPDNNFAVFGGGWYFNAETPTGAVTTWYDVFVNWPEQAAALPPIALIPQPTQVNVLIEGYGHKIGDALNGNYVPVQDAPPAENMSAPAAVA